MTVLLIDIERTMIISIFLYYIFIKLFVKKYFRYVERKTNLIYDENENIWMGHPLKGKDGDKYVYLLVIPLLIVSLMIANYLSGVLLLSWTELSIVMIIISIYVIVYVIRNNTF